MKTYVLGINIDNEEKEVLFIDAENYSDLINKYEALDKDFSYDVFDVQSFSHVIKHPDTLYECKDFNNCNGYCRVWEKSGEIRNTCIIK